jgi:hypothetical protein
MQKLGKGESRGVENGGRFSPDFYDWSPIPDFSKSLDATMIFRLK